jgi:hypothetical protein
VAKPESAFVSENFTAAEAKVAIDPTQKLAVSRQPQNCTAETMVQT